MATVKKKRKINVKNLLIVILAGLLLVCGGLFIYYKQSTKPVSTVSEIVIFTVESGESTKTVLSNLEDNGIIKNELMASLYVKINGLSDVKAGMYELDKSWTIAEIFEQLNDPTAALTNDVRITFIEGDWLKHMADKVQENTNVSSEELLELWNNEEYVRSLMTSYPFLTEEIFNENSRYLLEGYLFPSTYDFYRDTTAEAVTKKLLDQTLKIYNTYASQIASKGYTVHDAFTLASIVQYEAGSVNDMKLIAGVFLNRLEIGMKLQSSVTVCYALDLEDGSDWKACETNPSYESPYNTYMYAGLPPGPILNFGEAALEAVLNPTESNYFYFMADVYGDGQVYYAETLEEHEANVDQYLR
ncbi:MAG: endolytic transglycosylase MltG [Anaerorhabdus sp.]